MYKKTKYNNKITELDGIRFHSRKESVRYSQLKLYEKGGLIKDLRLQVPYELIPKMVINGKTERAIKYVADFVYIDMLHETEVVEDVKGMITDIFKIKYRLMKQIYNIDIKIT
jgi:predicted nucleic acid-binding protein